jgi:hypothetical protein
VAWPARREEPLVCRRDQGDGRTRLRRPPSARRDERLDEPAEGAQVRRPRT